MQKRLAQKIAVRGVPQIAHLTSRAFIGKKPQYMQGNRNGDLAYGSRLVPVFHIRLDVFHNFPRTLRHWRQKLFLKKGGVNQFDKQNQGTAEAAAKRLAESTTRQNQSTENAWTYRRLLESSKNFSQTHKNRSTEGFQGICKQSLAITPLDKRKRFAQVPDLGGRHFSRPSSARKISAHRS